MPTTTPSRPGRRAGIALRLALAAAAAAAIVATPPAARAAGPGAGPQVVYGKDNRLEIFESSARVQKAADASVSLFHGGDVAPSGGGTSRLATESYAASYELCPGERFAAERVGPFCSGVLVAPDVVATAGHCVDQATLGDVRFVFGFKMRDAAHLQATVPDGQVYRGARLLGRRETADADDYAVVRLDRPVPDHVPARLRRGGTVAAGEAIYVIGYPAGLPAKSAGGARVLGNAAPSFFTANLDTYGGNSGSPVFGAAADDVVGLLVRGASDFVRRRGCYVSNILPNAVGGESSTRTTRWASFVPGR